MARWGWCPSGRFFEAAACATPLITDWWEGLDRFFDVEHDLQVVSRTHDVEHALTRDNADLLRMALRARERTLNDHTGEVRARQLLGYIEEAFSSAPGQRETSALRSEAVQ
jgi:spore maturation protein CgeB